ncbi:hypothetical protein JCM5353_001779 [Sporobolomyces roseus]
MVPRQTSPPPAPPQIDPEPDEPSPQMEAGKGEKESNGVAVRDYATVVASNPRKESIASSSGETFPSTSTNTPLTRSRTPSPTPLSPPREKPTTTTPPTPKSSGSREAGAGGGNGGNLDEFGLPRIAPPTGYFDGDNEFGTEIEGLVTSGQAGETENTGGTDQI